MKALWDLGTLAIEEAFWGRTRCLELIVVSICFTWRFQLVWANGDMGQIVVVIIAIGVDGEDS